MHNSSKSNDSQAVASKYMQDLQLGNTNDAASLMMSDGNGTAASKAAENIDTAKSYDVKSGYKFHKQYPGNTSSQKQYGFLLNTSGNEIIVVVTELPDRNYVSSMDVVSAAATN